MNKTRLVLAVLAGALGLALGRMSGAWGFEQSPTYRVLSSVLLIATLIVAIMRLSSAGATSPIRNHGVVERVIVVVALMFCAALFATFVGSKASDASMPRYLMVAAAFVPLAVIRRSAHQFCNTFASPVLLTFVPVMTAIAWGVAGDVNVWLSPILFMIPTVAVVLPSGRLPSVSDERVGQIETGLAMTAAFITGVTAVSSSYDYDAGPAVIIGVIMVVVGWFMGVLLRRWEYAPSRAMTWQNLVIAVWIGQFMPGAAVMTAIALAAGWALYGTLHGIAVAARKARERRENAAA